MIILLKFDLETILLSYLQHTEKQSLDKNMEIIKGEQFLHFYFYFSP